MKSLIPPGAYVADRSSYLDKAGSSAEKDLLWFDSRPQREIRIRRVCTSDYSLFQQHKFPPADAATELPLIFITYSRPLKLVVIPDPRILLPLKKKLQVLQKMKNPPTVERLSMTLGIALTNATKFANSN